MRIERAIEVGNNDTSITKDYKEIGPITMVWRNILDEVLTFNLVQLGLVVIDDS